MRIMVVVMILCFFPNKGWSAVPSAPSLTVTTSGSTATISWSSVSGATGYTLFYAPNPAATPIKSIDMGSSTSFSATLPAGSAYYLAVKATNGSGSSGYSNIEHFSIGSSTSNCSIYGTYNVSHSDSTGSGDWSGQLQTFSDNIVRADAWTHNMNFDYTVYGYTGRVKGSANGTPNNSLGSFTLNGTSFKYIEQGSVSMSGTWSYSSYYSAAVSGTASYRLVATGTANDACTPTSISGTYTVSFSNPKGDFPSGFTSSGTYSGTKKSN